MKIDFGNHDTQTPSLLNQYMDHLKLKEQFYSFDYHNVHFLALSTEMSYEVGSGQYNFTINDLTQAKSNSNLQRIVVYSHRPIYASSILDPKPELPTLKYMYHPLFEKCCDVDLILQAHNHVYERSKPLTYNIHNSAIPIVTNEDANTYFAPKCQYLLLGYRLYNPYSLPQKAIIV